MNVADFTDSSSDDDGAFLVQAVSQLQMDIFMVANVSSCFNQFLFETDTGYKTYFSVNVKIGEIERFNNLIRAKASCRVRAAGSLSGSN